jgi:hypothetical protein
MVCQRLFSTKALLMLPQEITVEGKPKYLIPKLENISTSLDLIQMSV